MKELKQIHATVIKTKHLQTQLVWTKLISFCALSPFGNLDYARLVFAKIENPNLTLYNLIIRGFSCTKENPLGSSFYFYRKMLEKGFVPDNFTLPFLLKACARSKALREGELIHCCSIKTGFSLDVYVKNTLMRLYAVCGLINAVQKLFDESPQRDLVSWTTLIQGYAKMGFSKEAIRVFLEMAETKLRADEMTMVIVLSACSKLGDLDLGRKIHRYMYDNMVNLDVFVGNAVVDMYLKCGDIDFACKFFEEMPEKNVVSWNSMIVGLAHQGEFKEALSVFRRMQGEGVKPDDVTLVGVLNSCANLGVLELGEWVHSYIDRNQIKADGYIGNALVDMYAKCGRIDQAFEVFKNMTNRDVFSYTSMIVGLAMNGQGENALEFFSEMTMVGIKPDEVTFIGVLSACSHVGLVEEGKRHFEEMSRLYNLKPQIEHYGCMVDLLGRAGFINEAEEFIRTMPIEPDAFVWGALLGACKTHGKVELAERIMKKLVEIEPERDGAYVLMSNIYSSANRWKDAVEIRKAMKERKMKKIPGCSLIELDGVIHEFRKGDKSHTRTKEIYLMLNEVMNRLKIEGFVTETSNVLVDVAEEEKEQSLCYHSERLAIAFGLISTKPGTPLRIVKNLRVCNDCHSVTKFISRVFEREIVVRDRNRFHHFRGGSCSCNDFW
ncbi:Pentatricopeptide repeat [Macleaya cordata]|uniref:Pentatricopeptide repeat n=1 Tax=Macleaya cordata TaxID=56857 RepID=A0A200R2L0_MACCD|nr:Pentatricopeptide repeat [Macleaya cordata]